MTNKSSLLSSTFVELADSLVDQFDIIELLTILSHRCVDLFGAGAAAILLGDQRGTLQVVAASTEQARLLELFQLQNDEGPCLDCFANGVAVVSGDLAATERWPLFGPEAISVGFHSVQAFPLRLRDVIIGSLNVFMERQVVAFDDDLQICQALADVATIAILQSQRTTEATTINIHLQSALDSRIAIEQAKGILAERSTIDVSEAFSQLRAYARSHNRQLSEVAGDVVAGSLALDASTMQIEGTTRRPPG